MQVEVRWLEDVLLSVPRGLGLAACPTATVAVTSRTRFFPEDRSFPGFAIQSLAFLLLSDSRGGAASGRERHVILARAPELVKDHAELSRDRHNRPLVGVGPTARGQLLAPLPQSAVLSEVA